MAQLSLVPGLQTYPPILPQDPIENAPNNVRDEIISQIAYATLKEFVISMSISTLTCLFVATPGGVVLLLAGTVTMVAINALIRSGIGYFTYHCHTLEQDGSDEALALRDDYQDLISYANYLCPINFSTLDVTTRNVLIHEGGHALAALALYEQAQPQVTVFPFEGGVTEFIPERLSELGQKVGAENAHIITAAAGSGLAILFATLNLIVGHNLSESNPELSRYLNVTALVTVLQHIVYALSAFLGAATDGHDFYFLWQTGGIHPLISVAVIVLTPLIAKTILYAIDQLRACASEEAAQPVIAAEPQLALA